MAIDLDVHGNTKPLEAAVQAAINRIRRQPIKITVDDKGATQPLGNMKRAADEFSKSMEAANARILAFGASMAIINGVADAFKGMVRNLVEVEKSLADINVVMGLSTQNLDKFGDGLFKVAKETGAAFRVAADAATEYARQGLSMEESLKRTRDALILTRLTGMDSAEAVKSLTAAMNTYGNQIKDTTQLVSKFAAVDVQFAVSAEDFAAAISRTGQAAKSAGVSIDELIGIVTSAQQQTARGGAVIGNALKTIFTKTGRTDTLNQLENLGIAVRDLEGNTIGAKRILTDLANTFDKLSEAQKAQITQTMGGLFHINILKAVLSDAAKQNGILANATQISANATDEAIQKNEQLRQTMSAMATETGLAVKQLSVQIGELMLAPGMEKILNTVKSIAEGAGDLLGDGESAGGKFANGFLKGLGNIITGPGLVVLTTVFVKLFMTAAKFTKESLSSLMGVTNEAQKQKAIQTSLVALIGQNAALGKEMLRTDISRTEKEKILLGLLQMQTAEANKLNTISKQLATTLYTRGYGPGLTTGKRRAYGHIPNFADPERSQAARGGYAAGSIRTMNMPGEGSVIYNSAEKVKNFAGFKQPAIMPPQSSKAGKNYQQAFGSIHGFDPYAAGGYIPNFSKPTLADLTTGQLGRLKAGEKIKFKNVDYFADDFGGKKTVVDFSSQLKPKDKQPTKSAPASGLANTPINLNKIRLTGPRIRDMGVLLGYGSEGRAKKVKYRQSFGSLPESARKHLLPYMGPKGLRKMPKQDSSHWKRDVEVTLPTKAVYAVSEDDAQRMEEAVGADTLQAALKRYIGPGFDKFSSKIGQKLFGSKSKGVDVLKKHVLSDGSALGALFEAGVRGALNNKKLTGAEQQRAFDFMGDNARRLSDKFMGIGKRNYIEAKKDLGAASRGDIPKKVLNAAAAAFIGPMKPGAASGYIPNFAAMTISRLGGLGKSKFGLAAVINSNPYFAQLLRRYGHWKNFPPQEKAKLNKFLLKQGFTNRTLQGYGLASVHSKSIGEGIANIAAAGGYIPNFADPLSDAIGREKAAGVPVSQIRVGSHSALMSKGNPLGLGVTNTHDEPNGLRDVFGANGFVPNYAVQEGFMGKVGAAFGSQQSIQRANEAAEKLAEEQKKLAQSVKNDREARTKARDQVQRLRSEMNKEENLLKENHKIMNDRKKSGKQRQKAAQAYLKSERKLKTTTDQFNQARNQLRSTHQQLNAAERKLRASSAQLDSARRTAASRASRGQSGMAGMGLMMGLPMLAGFIPGADKPGSAGGIASGVMSGAATGAALGMIFPGWGTAIGAAVGALGGLVSSLKESRKAMQEESIQRAKSIANMFPVAQIGEKLSGPSGFGAQTVNKFLGGNDLAMNFKTVAELLKVQVPEINKQENVYTTLNEDLTRNAQGSMIGGGGSGDLFTPLDEGHYPPSEKTLKSLNEYNNYIKQTLPKQKAVVAELINSMGPGLEMLPSVTKNEEGKPVLSDKLEAMTFKKFGQEIGDAALFEGEQGIQNLQAVLALLIARMDESKVNTEKMNEAIINRTNKEKILLSSQDEFNKAMHSSSYFSQMMANEYKLRMATMSDYMTEEEIASAKLAEAKRVAADTYSQSVRQAKQTAKEALINLLKDDKYEQGLTDYLKTAKDGEKMTEKEFGEKGLSQLQDAAKEILKGVAGGQKMIEEIIGNQNYQLDIQKGKYKGVKDLAESRAELEKRITDELISQKTGPGAMGRGMDAAFFSMREQVKTMDYELGKKIPYAFADGLANAMSEGLSGAKSIGDALRDSAISFLQMIQQAMLQKAAYSIVGAMGFSGGGNVRNYSRGGGVPAMVSNGEYVMGRDAVAKYGGSFMHGLNAGGKIPGYSNGGSALAANFGGGRGHASGRAYQSRAMSGFFYSQSGNVGLGEDTNTMIGILQEEERKRQEAEARRQAKKAKRRQLIGSLVGIAAGAALSHFAGGFGKGPSAESLGRDIDLAAAPEFGKSQFFSDHLTKNFPASSSFSTPKIGGYSSLVNSTYGGTGLDRLSAGVFGRYLGGPIRKYASGGYISGKSGIDQIPAMLSEGEYVIRASSARQLGKPMLDRINAGKFNEGGAVSELMGSSETASSGGNTNNINISINMERGSASKKENQSQDNSGQNPADRSSDEQNNAALADRIKQQVVAVIVEEQRPGGLLSE